MSQEAVETIVSSVITFLLGLITFLLGLMLGLQCERAPKSTGADAGAMAECPCDELVVADLRARTAANEREILLLQVEAKRQLPSSNRECMGARR